MNIYGKSQLVTADQASPKVELLFEGPAHCLAQPFCSSSATVSSTISPMSPARHPKRPPDDVFRRSVPYASSTGRQERVLANAVLDGDADGRSDVGVVGHAVACSVFVG
jgi:hypothetical protein